MTARKTTAKTTPAESPEQAEPDEAPEQAAETPCVECWPNGWPTPTTNSAGCEHGSWNRDVPAE